MTDKQIIIDSVDVSGCDCFIAQMDFPNNLEGGYYNQNNLCECGIQGLESYPFFCKDNPNCYYKQLKRAKQKLEKIKQYLCENVCLEGENCKFCDNHDCINIEILQIIEE